MVELARLMTELGADEALNLDGGGSSTMVAPQDQRQGAGAQLAVGRPAAGGPQRARGLLHPACRRQPARRAAQPTTDSSTSTTATVVAAAKHSTGLVVAFDRLDHDAGVGAGDRDVARGVAADVDDRGVRRLVVRDLEVLDELDQPGLHAVVVELRGELLGRRDVGERNRARRDHAADVGLGDQLDQLELDRTAGLVVGLAGRRLVAAAGEHDGSQEARVSPSRARMTMGR